MTIGLFTLAGTALGLVGGFAVEWWRERSQREARRAEWRRNEILSSARDIVAAMNSFEAKYSELCDGSDPARGLTTRSPEVIQKSAELESHLIIMESLCAPELRSWAETVKTTSRSLTGSFMIPEDQESIGPRMRDEWTTWLSSQTSLPTLLDTELMDS